MLIQLNIKNFALIEDISVQFDKGFSILSGETGAGKSILIDAIDFVLGGKFSKDSIRTGEKSTFVEAVFSLENNNLEKILEELGHCGKIYIYFSVISLKINKSSADFWMFDYQLNQWKVSSRHFIILSHPCVIFFVLFIFLEFPIFL